MSLKLTPLILSTVGLSAFFTSGSFGGGRLRQSPIPDSAYFPSRLDVLDYVITPSTDALKRAEGCTDYIVVPPYPSGPTISCGIDLGHIGLRAIDTIFTGLVSDSVLQVLRSASGVRGKAAQAWRAKHKALRIPPAASALAFRRSAALLWSSVYRGQMSAAHPVTKASLLSFAYHTGRSPAPVRKLKHMSSHQVANLLRRRGSTYSGGSAHTYKRRRDMEARAIDLAHRQNTVPECHANSICLPES